MQPRRFATSKPPPLRARLAAWLGMLAVFCALWAPVSMLAQDVQSGKLSGLCSASNSFGAGHDEPASTAGGAACELCGFIGLMLPGTPPLATIPFAAPLPQLAPPAQPLSAAVPGLPFSRGPPVFLI